jgi:hypothetical protein
MFRLRRSSVPKEIAMSRPIALLLSQIRTE